MPEPHLHVGDIGLVLKGGGRAKGVEAESIDRDSRLSAVRSDHFVDAAASFGVLKPSSGVVLDRVEVRAGLVLAMSGVVQIVVERR